MSTTQARMAELPNQVRGSVARPRRTHWLYVRHSRGFIVKPYEAAIEHLPAGLDGLRIAHLTDLHIKDFWSNGYDELIERMEQLAPDLILVTGDIVDARHEHFSAMPHVERLLTQLKAPLGLYTILGNHDNLRLGYDLENVGVPCLVGQRKFLHHRGAELELIGAPGPERELLRASFATSFGPPQRGIPRVLMAHFPDHYPKLKKMEPDLYLCGHTHGGQVCLPGGKPLVLHDSSPKELCHGIHRLGRTHYIVNHGFGFSGLPIRVFCPPEVVMIQLVRA